MSLPFGTRIKFKKLVEQDGIIFAQPDTEGVILRSGAELCGADDYIVKANDSDMEFMSGLDEFDVVEKENPDLKNAAVNLADQVFKYATFSGNCDDMKASEIKALIRPIFGQTVMDALEARYKR